MIRLFVVLTILCGVLYPFAVTLVGRLIFPFESGGSLVIENGKVIGSELISQKFLKAENFHSRPSAGDYSTVPSSASQTSPTQKSGIELITQRKALNPDADVDAWMASGSGLDPHISPKNAFSQVTRVAAARSMSSEAIRDLIAKHTEGPTFGIWGQPRVNVLKLNLELMPEGINGNTR